MGFLKVLNIRLEKGLEEVLELVGIADFRDRQIGKLSRRPAAKGLYSPYSGDGARIIFLDEPPLVCIDLKAQEDFNLLNRLNQGLKYYHHHGGP